MRYSIYCKKCEEEVALEPIPDEKYDMRCTHCGTVYSSEDGIIDQEELEDAYKLYVGAKVGGFLDEESVPREQPVRHISEWAD